MSIETGSTIYMKKEEVHNIKQMLVSSSSSSSKKKKSCALEFEELKKHFDIPINKVVFQMNVGLTMYSK